MTQTHLMMQEINQYIKGKRSWAPIQSTFRRLQVYEPPHFQRQTQKVGHNMLGPSYREASSPPPHSCKCWSQGSCCCCCYCCCCCWRLKGCLGLPGRRLFPAAARRRSHRASKAQSVASTGTPAGSRSRGPCPTWLSAVALLASQSLSVFRLRLTRMWS